MMWKDKYKIGIERIDEQHKELFSRVSDFIKSIRSSKNWEGDMDKVKEIMEFMKEYVDIHFSDEEAYQEKINYPEIENHKQEHIKFKEIINKYLKIFEEEGFTEEKVQEFGGKLMTWLIMHVCKTDQKIGEYVKNEGGKV
ncbi:bacteriohemerythrin [Defluviitalea phaphyphila]|uniref:bacteriohemerythrin n=1 Tax=Defluviitalea phaphyphila TaxID=1473580 RepID=UPI00072FFC0A|nr:hemerythrin family protein [Defluviitalea phaphyphila]